ncbi:MAG: glycosyltransferase [Firmicutes bacterium]|nr:glycosyltransferase [Bacillota bacterium]
MNPKASIIIPCYNAERFMALCLQSVLNQTLTNIEIICVDDGSTDSTLQILRTFQQKDSRVQIITQQNKFAGVARNAGMSTATGEFLYFLDSDDFIEPTMLAKMVAKCEQDNADICICGSVTYDLSVGKIRQGFEIRKEILPEKIPFSHADLPNNIFWFGNMPTWNKLFKADFISKNKLQYQPLKRSNDIFFSVSTMALAERITIVDYVFHNRHRGTSTSLQETVDDDPFTFHHATKAVKNFLIEQNLYEKLGGAVRKLAVGSAVHMFRMLKTKEQYTKMGNFLKKTHFPEFDVVNPKYYNLYLPHQMHDLMLIMSGVYKRTKNLQLRTDETTVQSRDLSLDFPLNDKLKVSVIIPILADLQNAYYENYENVEECVNSILRQSLVDIEIICLVDKTQKNPVDNFSDKRIRILTTRKNENYSTAYNMGINQAKGEYLFFLEPNDMLIWRALEHLYRRAKYYQLDIVLCQSVPFFEPIELSRDYKGKKRRSFIVNRKFLLDNQLFVPQTPSIYAVDMFMVDILEKSDKNFLLPEPLHRFRISQNSRHGISQTEQIYNLFLFICHVQTKLSTATQTHEQLLSTENAENAENSAEKAEKITKIEEIAQKIRMLKSYNDLYAIWLVETYLAIKPENIANFADCQTNRLTTAEIISLAQRLENSEYIQRKLNLRQLHEPLEEKPTIRQKLGNLKNRLKEKVLKSPFWFGVAYNVYKITGYKG